MIIYGLHPVEELVSSVPDRITALLLSDPDDRRFRDLVDAAKKQGVRIERVGKDELDARAEGGNHQGIAAETLPFAYATLEAVLEKIGDRPRACVVVLDGVQDPHNLGAILRSVAAFGANAVVIPKDRAAGITPAVVRASAGLALSVPVVQVTNVARTLDALKEERFWAVATVMDGDSALWEIDFDMRTALVMGGEGSGVRRLVLESCDFRARIPMAEGVESLNVSVAAAVCLYEIARPRGE